MSEYVVITALVVGLALGAVSAVKNSIDGLMLDMVGSPAHAEETKDAGFAAKFILVEK